jgi:hypothetical protein
MSKYGRRSVEVSIGKMKPRLPFEWDHASIAMRWFGAMSTIGDAVDCGGSDRASYFPRRAPLREGWVVRDSITLLVVLPTKRKLRPHACDQRSNASQDAVTEGSFF